MGLFFTFIVFLLAQPCDAVRKGMKRKSGAMVEENGEAYGAEVNPGNDPGIDDEDIPLPGSQSAFTTQKVARIDDSDSDGSSSLLWLLGAGALLAAWWSKNNPEKAKDAIWKARLVAEDAAGKVLDLPVVQQGLTAFGVDPSRLDFLRSPKAEFHAPEGCATIRAKVPMPAPMEAPMEVPLVQEASFEADFAAASTPEQVAPPVPPPSDLLDGMDSTPPAPPLDLLDPVDGTGAAPLEMKAEESLLF